MMMPAGEFKNGTAFKYNGEPYIVTKFQHLKLGKSGGARMVTKVRNIINGKVLDITFNSIDKVEKIETEMRTAQYLYEDGSYAYFMDPATFEQTELPIEACQEDLKFLKPEQKVTILKLDDKPVKAVLPLKVTLRVTETMDGVDRGNTAGGQVLKEATLETGVIVKVPAFIKTGELINVNTETEEYVERVSEDTK